VIGYSLWAVVEYVRFYAPINSESKTTVRDAVPNKYAKLCVGLSFMKRRFERTELIYKTSEGPYVRLGVVCLFLHQLGRHIVWSLANYEIKIATGKDRHTPT
jgi:hypothetical protein